MTVIVVINRWPIQATRIGALLLVLGIAGLTIQKTEAQDPSTVVMLGYDVVAYFGLPVNSTGVMGTPALNATHRNYTFHFSTEENRQLFINNPDMFVPQYGAFCAWGMAYEYMPKYPWTWPDETKESWRSPTCLGPPCDPKTAVVIHNGKLYCAIDLQTTRNFLSKAPESIELADERWANWTSNETNIAFNTICLTENENGPCHDYLTSKGCCNECTNPWCPH